MSLAVAVAVLEEQLAAERSMRLEAERLLAAFTRRVDPHEIEDSVSFPVWSKGLTPSEIETVKALAAAYPRWLSPAAIEAIIPSQDHAGDRGLKIIDVHVCRIRKKLGGGVIESRPGYRRLSDEGMALVNGEAA